jgi:hypothetical protein
MLDSAKGWWLVISRGRCERSQSMRTFFILFSWLLFSASA